MGFRRLALATAIAIAAAAPAAAQARPRVSVTASSASSKPAEGPAVSIQNVFSDRRSQELLASGFPARIAMTVELWASRTLFDNLLLSRDFERVVRYDPLYKKYLLGRVVDTGVVEEGRFDTLDEVSRVVAAPTRIPFPAPTGRRGLYYTVSVLIETFNSNDLLEVRRWLNGEAKPAVKGQGNPVSAIARGLATLFSRVLGGDVKRLEGRSEVFDT